MGLRAVDVLLSGAAQLAFEDLQRGTDKVSASIVRKIRRFKDILLADCQCGEVVRKSSIPKALKKKHGLENLSVCDLPSAWRLLYTIVRVGDKPYITIVEIVDHDAYDKWFPSDR